MKVHDSGVPPRHDTATLKIQVGDINDNPPAFVEPKDDIVGIREEQPIGAEVVHVQAVDNDAGINGTVVYSLIKGNNLVRVSAMVVTYLTSIS